MIVFNGYTNYSRGSWVPRRMPNSVTDKQLGLSQAILSLQEVKDDLKIEFDAEDDYIIALILECQSRIENYCGISLSERTVKAELCNMQGDIELPYGPVLSITYIVNAAGFSGSFDDSFANGTDLTDQAQFGGIDFLYLKCPFLHQINIQYQAGYNDDNPVPYDLKKALKMEIAFRYSNRIPGTDLRANVNPALCNESILYADPFRRNKFL